MKCEESYILKTENFEEKSEIFKIFPAVSVQNHKDMIESDNHYMWKNRYVIIMRDLWKQSILIGFYYKIYEILGRSFCIFPP